MVLRPTVLLIARRRHNLNMLNTVDKRKNINYFMLLMEVVCCCLMEAKEYKYYAICTFNHDCYHEFHHVCF